MMAFKTHRPMFYNTVLMQAERWYFDDDELRIRFPYGSELPELARPFLGDIARFLGDLIRRSITVCVETSANHARVH